MKKKVPIIGECQVCGDRPGEIGQHYPPDVPLGELETCELCGKRVCPVCYHESECCFGDYEDGQPAPPGWRNTGEGYFEPISKKAH